MAASSLVMIAGGIFIAPFFLFSGASGTLADRMDKAAIARWVKIAEIAIMALGAWGLWQQSVPAALRVAVLPRYPFDRIRPHQVRLTAAASPGRGARRGQCPDRGGNLSRDPARHDPRRRRRPDCERRDDCRRMRRDGRRRRIDCGARHPSGTAGARPRSPRGRT